MRNQLCKGLFLTLSFLLVLFSNLSAQQDIDFKNLSSINVDDLSNTQIQEFVDKMDASGYTEDQLILMAKSRGMSELQIQKLRNRMNQLRSVSGGSGMNVQQNRFRDSENPNEALSQQPKFDPFVAFDTDSTSYINGLPIFGHDFFENSALTFETGLNMPTPANYVIGAGDEIIIDIWGASEQTYQVNVSPEGSIRIPNLGPIYISGLTIEKAKGKIISKLKRIYSTIGGSSNADVTLGQTRSINVHVIGAVRKPGTYKLSSFSTAFNALYSAGGPSQDGSLRKIEIFRNSKLISTLDSYAFMVRGTGENITLQDQDVVIVRSYVNRILFVGEVKKPAYYEMLNGESFDDLMLYSGGLTDKAYRGKISVRRVEGNFKTIKSIDLDSANSVDLKNGDEIQVGKIANKFVKRVTIEGPVLNPGEYELQDGMTLSQLIESADGVRGDLFTNRGVIIRQNADFSLSNISFNPTDVLNGIEIIPLQNNDIIRLQSIYDLREQYNLVIQGEVQRPGRFAFIDGMTVEDLIFLAGGFKESAAKSMVEVARRINPNSQINENRMTDVFNLPISETLDLSEKDSKFKLVPYDLVVIRKSPFYQEQELVEIEGEVKFPGKYALDKIEERISDLLNRAGGVTQFAYVKGATLIRRSEYYKKNLDDPGYANDAVKIRKENLAEIFNRDTLLTVGSSLFKQQEAIGIELEKIINNPGSEFDLILREGDIISIPRQLQTVRVRGSVLYPSNIRYLGIGGLKKYVSAAGGFDQDAKKSKSYVIYANGSAAQTKGFLWFKNYPKIEPGAEIVIPQKPDKQPMSAQAWVAFASSVATIALVVSQIVR